MQKQFSELNGLQNPIFGEMLSFKMQRKTNHLCRSCMVVKLHWIVISTFRCNTGEVCYTDSLFKGIIADHTKQQFCVILNYELKHVKTNVLPIKQQSNGVDCGVSALAF